MVQRNADPEANIIFGTVTDESMGEEIQITVIATGFEKDEERRASIPGYENIVADAWRRRNANSTNTATVADTNSSNDLDIPAFLRKNKGLGGK